MLDNIIRLAPSKLFEAIITRQYGTGKNPALLRRLDVMLHITDKEGFVALQCVLLKKFQNLRALVPHSRIRPFKESIKTILRTLRREVFLMDSA